MLLRYCVLILLLLSCNPIAASPSPTSTPEPERFVLDGHLTAPACGGGYAIEGSGVVVRNEQNEVIGSAKTELRVNTADATAEAKARSEGTFRQDSRRWECEVSYSVTLPRAKFYIVKIGSHDGPAYSFDELASRNWRIDSTLS